VDIFSQTSVIAKASKRMPEYSVSSSTFRFLDKEIALPPQRRNNINGTS